MKAVIKKWSFTLRHIRLCRFFLSRLVAELSAPATSTKAKILLAKLGIINKFVFQWFVALSCDSPCESVPLFSSKFLVLSSKYLVFHALCDLVN